MDSVKTAKHGWRNAFFLLLWLAYAAGMVWYPVHESIVARERVAAADFAKCKQHSASRQAAEFCNGDYARDLAQAQDIQWRHHPLWSPMWLGSLVLLLPPFAVYGMIWILTRGAL